MNLLEHKDGLVEIKNKNRKDGFLRIIIDYLIIIGVAVTMALNYQLFIIENNYAPAGLNGIATMIQYKTGFSIGYFSLIINIPLCLLAFIIYNRQYALRTFCFVFSYSFAYIAIGEFDISTYQYNAHEQNVVFPVLLSGVISGICYGVLFSLHSSTGGTDIISRFLSVKKPELNFFWVVFFLNFTVAVSSFFVYSKKDSLGTVHYNYLPVCLCVLYCFVSSFVGDYFLKGTKKACEFTIITQYPDEITKRIRDELKHGCTKICATGGYTNAEKTILLCVINKQQITDLKSILADYDQTFGFSEIVTETYGNFKRIK